jgi:hypothetical protein
MTNAEPGDEYEIAALLRAMAERDRAGDVAFAAVETRILRDYDSVIARRQATLAARCGAVLRRLADAAWPGAPMWKPACALAISLAVGLGVGAVLPFYGQDEETNSASIMPDAPSGMDMGEDLR